MTLFVDLRATPHGGLVAGTAEVLDGATGLQIRAEDFGAMVSGRAVVLATHGFNVSGNEGIVALTGWDTLASLPAPFLFIGVLWPGDSRFVPVLDYPIEGGVAVEAGRLLAKFVDSTLAGATSVSLVSHSLGARVVLECVRSLQRPKVACLMLMAAAIESDTLSNEYAEVVAKVGRLHVVASREDLVLEVAFPVGNPFTQWLLKGHPLFRQALGREGPYPPTALAAPTQVWQFPDGWDYGHLDYMPGSTLGSRFAPPGIPPTDKQPEPAVAQDPWRPGWAALIIATEFD